MKAVICTYIPQATPFLAQCKQVGLKIALWSEESEEAIRAAVQLPLDFVLGGKVVQHAMKPVVSSWMMGLSPSDSLVIATDKETIAEAHQAGAKVLAVTEQVDAVTAGKAGADIIVNDLDVFTPFSTVQELEAQLDAMTGEDDSVRYGASKLVPYARLSKEHDALLRLAFSAAQKTRLHAYAPYSHFKVGAALVSAGTGRIYSGCNVENGSYGATICAERNAVLHAIAEEGTLGVAMLVVVTDANPPSPPCAQCLQVLSEFCNRESEIYLMTADGATTVSYTFKDLLPHAFVLEQS